MQNNVLELISGSYTNVLWENLEEVLTNENSLSYIHDVLETLYDCGKDQEAFAFVRILYDIAGLSIPDVVETLSESDDIRSSYIAELLVDIENIS